MDGTIAEHELAQRLTEMLDRVRLRGERLTIDREGEPIAVLSPVGEPITSRQVAERLAELGFPGDGFTDDLEAAQAAQPHHERPAWPS
jgi:antitoxin (DNA-binding transcriptional repressor) of toxin-antitoxin stability system